MDFEKKYKENYYDSFEKKAEKIISSTEKTSQLINDAMEKATKISNGPVDDIWANLQVFFDLMKDWIKGNYKNVPLGSIIMITASIIYFLTPFDIIPDFIIGLGYIDDLSIISYTFKQIQNDIDKYQIWKSVRELGNSLD
ncbi:MAG: DUF1232 domain-containing protein [Clostridia bacterium]|jgi:uncharacterized membrane protein YkvA (DUF1232 family)|nr:DUF1232 domain-containing protein [Clostridia bacterium]